MDYNKTALGKQDNINYNTVLLDVYRKRYEKDAIENQELLSPGFIAVTHKGLSNEKSLFNSHMDVATLVAIASFGNIINNELVSNMVSLEMIMSRLQFTGNISRKRQEVKESINLLIKKGIVKAEDLSGNEVKSINNDMHSTLLTFVQQTVKKGSSNTSYYQIKWSELTKIVNSELSDAKKTSLIATLCSLKSSMNDVRLSGNKKLTDITLLNKYRSLFCLSNQDKIAKRVGFKSRQTATNYINELEEMGIIKSIKVHRVGEADHVWSYYYSDLSRYKHLLNFAEGLINVGFIDNDADSKYHNLAYLNIDKVYNEGVNIVKDGKEFKVRGE